MPELPGPPDDVDDLEPEEAWRAGAAKTAETLGQQCAILASAYDPEGDVEAERQTTDDSSEEDSGADRCPKCDGPVVNGLGGERCADCDYRLDTTD